MTMRCSRTGILGALLLGAAVCAILMLPKDDAPFLLPDPRCARIWEQIRATTREAMADGKVKIYDGKLLITAAGKVAVADDCCCGECDCCDCVDVQATITVVGGNADLQNNIELTDEDVLDIGPTMPDWECDYDVGDEIMAHAGASWEVKFRFDEDDCEWDIEVAVVIDTGIAVWDVWPVTETISGDDCFPVSFVTIATKAGQPDATITITLDCND